MSGHGEGEHAPGELERRTCLSANRLGLHARAAAKFVRMAGAFDAEVWVIRNGTRVSGISILGLMMLAAAPGTEITLEARGQESAEVLAALIKLVDDKFDED
jgi:phosphocarrier protein HPr